METIVNYGVTHESRCFYILLPHRPRENFMKNYYKISEFAALCGLSRDTLLHYDHTGVLKPAFVAPSGYRYYTLSQFTTVDLIAVLKASGTPLSEIRRYLQNADVPTGIRLLEGKVQDLRARRAEIDRMIQSLEQTLDAMREGEESVCGRLSLTRQRERYLIATPTGYRTPPTERQFARAMQAHFAECEQCGLGTGFQAGEIIPRERALQGRFLEAYYFSPLPGPVEHPHLWTCPAGTWAVYYYQGGYDELPTAYALFLEELARRGLHLAGDVYEQDVINYLSVTDPARYVLRLSAPVEE